MLFVTQEYPFYEQKQLRHLLLHTNSTAGQLNYLLHVDLGWILVDFKCQKLPSRSPNFS